MGGFILKTKNTGYMKTLLTDRMKTHVLLFNGILSMRKWFQNNKVSLRNTLYHDFVIVMVFAMHSLSCQTSFIYVYICVLFYYSESAISSNRSLLNEETSDTGKKRKRRRKKKALSSLRQESKEQTNSVQSVGRSSSHGSCNDDDVRTRNLSDSDSPHPIDSN